MSRLPLSGPLPDTIPEDSNLVVWYSINRDPITGKPAGEGFTGKLPRSLANAKKLAFVELSGHKLIGDVPVLPPNIRMFEVHNNLLDGPVECECGTGGWIADGGTRDCGASKGAAAGACRKTGLMMEHELTAVCGGCACVQQQCGLQQCCEGLWRQCRSWCSV